MPEESATAEATVSTEQIKEAVATAEESAEEQAADPFDDSKVETFDRAYVENLRKENAKYRTRSQRFETSFSDLPTEAVEGFLGLAEAYKTDPVSARGVLQALLAELPAEEAAAIEQAIEEETTEEAPKSMTPEEVEKLIAEREAKQELERQEKANFDAMKSEIETLGYSLKEDEPNPDTALLFFFAGQQAADQPKNWKEADKAVQEFKSAVIDDFKKSVQEKRSHWYRNPGTGATPTDIGAKKKLSVGDGSAAAAALEFLNSSE